MKTAAKTAANTAAPAPSRAARIVAALSLSLAACGDGGTGPAPGNNNNNNNNPPPDSITVAAGATATAIGATPLSTDTTTLIFDVTADIGDTWRLIMNTATKQFTVLITSTRLGLNTAAGTYTKTPTSDSKIDKYTSTAAGAQFDVAVDSRTKVMSGVMTVHQSGAASVSGTGYGVSSLATMAGDYVFMSFTYPSGGHAGGPGSEASSGTLRITSAGVMTMCTYGQINSLGNCTTVVNGTAPLRVTNLTGTPTTGGQIAIVQGSTPFGILLPHVGDRGAGFVIDRNGADLAAPTKTRAGSIYAVVQKPLVSSELNGKWDCSSEGIYGLRVDIKGSSLTGTSLRDTRSYKETISYNRIVTDGGSILLNGFANSHYNGSGTNDPDTDVMFIPMSTSMAVAGGDDLPAGRPVLCSRYAP